MTWSLPSLRQSHARKHGQFGTVRRRYSPDSFFLTILVFSSLALIKYAVNTNNPASLYQANAINRRDIGTFASTDEECRLVHQAKDQCAYISKHCPDEDPGFYSYLSLYYCTLSHVKPVAFMILVSWLGLLFSTIGIAASDFFCINLSTIATILGMSESMAGVTFLAFGNGSPDVFSTFAAFSTNSSSLAIGELFGAAGFISAVVAGSMALVRPFKVAKKAFIRDVLFFAVAAAFSLVFLWDGKLHLWECIFMVVFYVFYVAFVVAWHCLLTKRRRGREQYAAALGHFLIAGIGELDVQEEYHDEEDEESRSRPGSSRNPSTEDFSALERASVPDIKIGDEEDDDEMRDHWLGELSSNMRLRRTASGRRNTLAPVRPSLVGALEFQAFLKSLQRSKERQTIAMHNRRFSDGPSNSQHDAPELLTAASADPNPFNFTQPSGALYDNQVSAPDNGHGNHHGRTRAVSANDAASLQIDPRLFQRNRLSRDDRLLDIAEDDSSHAILSPAALSTVSEQSPSHTPDLTVSQADDGHTSNPWHNAFADPSPNYLAPPTSNAAGTKGITPPRSPFSGSPQASPRLSPRTSTLRRLPSLNIPELKSPRGSAPSSPFPTYNETGSSPNTRPPSLFLPASYSVDSQGATQVGDEIEKPVKWWPYKVLPPPRVLLYKLFPTFEHWDIKNWWERALAVVAAPSMLLLTITLPVIEAERDDEEQEDQEEAGHMNAQSPAPLQPYSDDVPQQRSTTDRSESSVTAAQDAHAHAHHINHKSSVEPGLGSAALATDIEQSQLSMSGGQQSGGPAANDSASGSQEDLGKHTDHLWNRWLLIVQLFLAPFFTMLVIETQYLDAPDGFQPLIKPMLISLLVSVILLVPLLLTTTSTHRPKAFTPILSMAGFVVSIAWISSIASQVVAVLKALAVIMNMSHAIMGLTIFAVGNSLGDLVADITVAKLGYPVMALSACFGGPMLNILLGIGLSGSYILIRGAEHRHQKHPGKEIKFRSYEIQVGETLIVSGITLLITLLALLIAVPMNKWMFSRRIGLCLIAVWVISTTVNVVLEVLGIGSPGGEESTLAF